MSNAAQCPSTRGKKDAVKPRTPRDVNAATGRAYWRSLDDLADTGEFRDFLEREFPAHASELSDPSRRNFLKVMGASLALAGAATVPGCRRPDHKIVAYNRKPEDVIHGKGLYYATAMALPGGGCEGLIVESHEGRPTKIEGNPLHPWNQGKSSIRAQSATLDLYDPDRLHHPSRADGAERTEATWAEFDEFTLRHFTKFDQSRGRGLVFLVDKQSSPSRDRMRDAIMQRWPQAMWLPYEAIDDENARAGAELAFGQPMRQVRDLSKATRIFSIENDFLGGESLDLPDQRGFAAGRRVLTTHGDGSAMNRLYVVESALSLTGAKADHRLRLKPSEVSRAGMAVMSAVLRRLGGDANMRLANAAGDWVRRSGGNPAGATNEWIEAAAADIVEQGAASAVLVGPSQPGPVHAVAAAVNAALGSDGVVVTHAPLAGDLAQSSASSIRALASAIEAGGVDTLVVLNANPVFDAPADLDFATKFARVPTTITLSVGDTETGAASTWQLSGTHFLEDWSDVATPDGALSVVQPLIAPLFDGRGQLALLASIAGQASTDPYEIVRETWRSGPLSGGGDFEKAWKRVLHDGWLSGSQRASGASPRVRAGEVEQALAPAAPAAEGMEIVFIACPKLRDGRQANNGWLQELPDPITKMTWDNPALISPATADRLGLRTTQDGMGVMSGQMATVQVNGQSLQIPVWQTPGVADDTIVLTLGYGREVAGLLGAGAGFKTYALRTTGAMRTATGASIERARGWHPLASTQDHHSLEGRSILREVDHQAWLAHGDEIDNSKDAYGNKRDLQFGERLGDLGHMPVTRDIFDANQLHPFDSRPQWGMTIDLSTCIGCSVCTIACQAENNIPVVGKTEVNKGREMHWIRVDRYFSGDAGGDVDVSVQPVACVHCEAAPCETVCPVNATVHGPAGTNDMAYNRCIGTRYCSNNCPYKVRRFNFFDYATKKLEGDYIGKGVLGGLVENEQMIPPRLREKIDEVSKLQHNPDVTVRERGVMEKCTYCMQRLNEASVERKLQGLDTMPDGFVQTACQQACPTNAIVFGDILDPESEVRKMRDHARSYGVLAYLNTRPRTEHLVNLRNPNPEIRTPVVEVFHHGEDHGEASPGGDAGHADEGHVMSLPVLSNRGAVAMGGAR
jgi:molybdopterin-containing oxidoreductase family iron-sulfur binding subunit